MKRRIVVSLLTLCMILSVFSGCGKKESGSDSAKMDKDHVYKEDFISYDINIDNVSDTFVSNDRIHFVTIEYDYDTFEVVQAFGKYDSPIPPELYEYIVNLGKRLNYEMRSHQ